MKSLFEQFGGIYPKERDYTIPNLEMPDTGNFEIGIYGQRRLYFLQHYSRVTYINLLTSGKLNETGQITLNEDREKENFPDLKISYVFRFNSVQFLLLCWDKKSDKIEHPR